MRRSLVLLPLLVPAGLAAQAPVPPGSTDPRLAQIVAAPSPQRLAADLRTLVGL